MRSSTVQRFRNAAVALCGATAFSSVTVAAPELRADAEDTISFRMLKHQVNDQGEVRLTIDARNMMEHKIAILFDKVTKAAVLKPGIDNNRTCPFIDLDRYHHTIDQIAADKLDFEIKAQIEPVEAKRALDASCVIVKIPSTRKINWKASPDTN